VNLEDKIDLLICEIVTLKAKVSSLEKENAQLKNKAISLECNLYRKNSSNSSTPPSKDENRIKPNQSLREKTGKKTGGQKGHKGTTLKMRNHVDEYLEHKHKYCTCCAQRLDDNQEVIGRRQVVDIPQITTIVTEHIIYGTQCNCGHQNTAKFPIEASCPISYGNNIETLIGYLSVRQYMSMERISEYLEQVCNLKLSQGTISNKLKSLANKCLPIYQEIKHRISTSKVVGADETGCVVNGEKHWVWTWQNKKLTYIAVSDTRGYRAITDNFSAGLPNSIIISDCWAAQLKTPCRLHQICLAHLQRELKYFIQSCKSKWCELFLKLIYQALTLKRIIIENPYKKYLSQIEQIKQSCLKMLAKKINAPKKLNALKNRLERLKESLWTFLDHYDVPPDNNASERAIRNVKVKQKVSGQFRSIHGANQFAVIRSVFDTINKNGGKVFLALQDIVNSQPE